MMKYGTTDANIADAPNINQERLIVTTEELSQLPEGIQRVAGKSLKEIYDAIPNKTVTYESWLRKLHRFADGNVRTTKRVQRKLGIQPAIPLKNQANFITYDGEGYEGKYILLANSLGERIVDTKGLSTEACLEFLSRRYYKSKRVWFGFSYDINNILTDVPDSDLLLLLDGQPITYKQYNISYVPGKIFSINNYRHYDVISFFATNFINVVEMMLGEDRVSKTLVEGKLGRGTFENWKLDDLIKYNDEELALLVEIMDKLRSALLNIGVRLNEWYGPGAIAKYWFKKYKVSTPSVPPSIPLYRGLQSAYYGGRFEQIKLGTFKNVYEYDIRSAYPSIMSEMPYFSDWKPVNRYANTPYSIWHITFDLRSYLTKGYRAALPLPIRSKDGHICFPAVGSGWYWNHEIRLLHDFFPNAKWTIHKGYVAKGNGRPFRWICELYDYRVKLKSEDNLSHYPIKVGLNSLYGKTAQTVGSNIYHSLAWAGYITSSTRVKIARAGYSTDPDNLIGFATDALFTTKKLNLPLSNNLGDWDESHFDSAIFFQSGVYRLQADRLITTKNPSGVEDRYRGSPLRHGIDDIIGQLQEKPSVYPEIKIGRFISHLLAIKDFKAYGKYRLEFTQIPHKLQIDTPFKRHYLGFIDKIDFDNGMVIFDYSKLLKVQIKSLPKIWADDIVSIHWQDNLAREFTDEEIITYPPKRKDIVLQRLIEDGSIAMIDSPFTDVESVDNLPVVEDIDEG